MSDLGFKSFESCLLHKFLFILVFFTIKNRIVQGVWIFSWILEKFQSRVSLWTYVGDLEA